MNLNESQADPVPEQCVEDGNTMEGKTMSLKESSDDLSNDRNTTKETKDFDATGNDEPNSHHTIGSARTPWYGTAFVLLSEVMGSGVLSLPNAAVTLGWGTALAALPIFAVFSAYSGWLLAKVKQEFPGVTSFADAANELVGPRFGHFTKVTMLVNWGALGIYFLIATSDAIGLIHNQGFLACQMNRTLIAAILLVIPCQCRDFHSISTFLSLPSSLAVVTAIAIIIAKLVSSHISAQDEANPPEFGDNTTVGPAAGTRPFKYFESLSSFVFAYQGQSIFMELMSEMKDLKQFPKANNLSVFFMFFVYTTTTVVVYGLVGNAAPGFLPDILDEGTAKVTVGILLVFHIMVSYVVTCLPLHVWFQSRIFPKSLFQDSFRGTMDWSIITVC